MKKLILALLAPFLVSQSLLALVTIAPVEIGDKPGLSRQAGLSLETKRGNTDKQNYKASLRISYDNVKEYVTWAEISAEYGESNNRKDTDKAFSHLRHIRKSGIENLNYEAFVQLQNDRFKLIKNRFLMGTGIRYKLFSFYGQDKGYFWLGMMNETIRYTSSDPSENNWRLNTSLAYTSKISNTSQLSYTFYYQPKINDFADFVTSNDFELKILILRSLHLQFKISYDTDSRPPQGVKKYDFSQTTSFVYEF